ncbi:hypothetical protein QFZ69_004630 [Arthrobacter sp. V1I7]|uniref:hypothetical protein n=1 Tax=Arthrobacter sp. V1I7 TaxID=3042274 RepID=UPI00277D18C1|nr:hypothetical protein [Arthrobacter sp. V1I7]MDQ0823684.1 hypothetical protein [Arthrobacter sp. V1I7]
MLEMSMIVPRYGTVVSGPWVSQTEMSDEKEPKPEAAFPASPWREASERLRSTARVFVASLGAVAVTVVAGLSLTALSTLDPESPNFAVAVKGALTATLGVVVMLALAMRLSSSSAVSMDEMLSLDNKKGRWWRGLLRPGFMDAYKTVGAKSNGYLAGFDDLASFSAAVDLALKDERDKADAAAAAPDDSAAYAKYKAANRKATWYDARLHSLIEVASFQRLRRNFAVTAFLMTLFGAATAIGIVTYAAALQPRGVPSSPVAVTTHDKIQIYAPKSPAGAALYKKVVGCDQHVDALVLGVAGASVTAITLPDAVCRSVTLAAKWDGAGYTATFDLPEEKAEPKPSATP